MKNKFTNLIISLVIISLIAVFGFFIYIIYDEIIHNFEVSSNELIFEENNSIAKEEQKEENISNNNQVIENPINKIETTNTTVNSNNLYETSSISAHFYNQLDNYSKMIYKGLVDNREDMKTGTKKVELGSVFTTLLVQLDGQELLGKYYQAAVEAYTYDNPEAFYLDPNKMSLNIETTTLGANVTYNVYINSGNNPNYLINEFSSKEQINNALAELEQVKKNILNRKTNNVYENIKMVHDYIVDNVSYDETLSKPNIYNIYGALVGKTSVCEGYAESMNYILSDMNIPCVLVMGKATNSEGKTENHAWNNVKINGIWYAIDTTWDDPIIIGGGSSNDTLRYKYFLKGSDEFFKNHTPIGQLVEGSKTFEYTSLSNKNYH